MSQPHRQPMTKRSSRSSAAAATSFNNEVEAAGPPLGLDWSQRLKHRPVPLRRAFTRMASGSQESPLARMLKGGRGGEVRLKLYLSLLWISVAEPHDTEYPARAWAELLGLPDLDGLGTRRVQAALAWLDREGFIQLKKSPGRPARAFLLDDDGSRQPYELPHKQGEMYVKVPADLWKNDWWPRLSAPGLAILLVLLDWRPHPDTGKPMWIAPSVKEKQYGLSPDTWTRGVAELSSLGVISVVAKGIAEGRFRWKRRRHTYRLKLDRLKSAPPPAAAPARPSPPRPSSGSGRTRRPTRRSTPGSGVKRVAKR